MKLAFDEEATSSQVDGLRKSLLQLRHPVSVMQTFAFTHSHVLLQPQLHAKTKEKTATLKYVTYFPVCACGYFCCSPLLSLCPTVSVIILAVDNGRITQSIVCTLIKYKEE